MGLLLIDRGICLCVDECDLQDRERKATMKGRMTDKPNLRTKKGRAQARSQGVPYNVVVNDIRYIWNPEQADRLATDIPENPTISDIRS